MHRDSPPDPEEALDPTGLETASGRYSVEFNVDGIAEGLPGDWTNFSRHHTLLEAIRSASDFLELAKDSLGIARVDDTADPVIEPWIRIMDLEDGVLVAWVDNGFLQVFRDFGGPPAPPPE